MSRIPNGIHRVVRLETAFRPGPWAFAENEAARINAHWARAIAEKPKLFDGTVLLLRYAEIFSAPDGDVLRGAFFDTSFRNFHAWHALGAPGDDLNNCFAMAALRTRDGAYLLGEMSGHTMNGGQIYFAAGTPDRNDIFGDKVDLGASVAREMEEETGFCAGEAPAAPGWTLIVNGAKIACMQERRLPLAVAEARARMDDFIARDQEPEFVRFHAAWGLDDIDTARMPDFVQIFLRDAFLSQPAG